MVKESSDTTSHPYRPGAEQAADSGERLAQKSRRYLPLGIDVSGLNCLVVGGGRIATRKALTLAESGAKVTVLAPRVTDRIRELAASKAISWKGEYYNPRYLDGFVLVIAATPDPALNMRIGQDAESRGILSCVVSPGRFSRVIFPATCSDGDVTIAVHSDGRDPARSRKVRDEILVTLQNRQRPSSQFTVFGVKRSHLPGNIFRSLTGLTASLKQSDAPGDEILFLATCQRWECYFVATSPRAVIHDIRKLVHEKCGVLLEAYTSAFYTKHEVGAFHHLLRVVAGLDSPLWGETEVVGQVRSALTRWLKAKTSTLKRIFASSLLTQKKVRKESGLRPARKDWAAATVFLLERSLSSLRSRRVLLVGCGRMGKTITHRLLQKGASVVPFSRRTKTSGVDWCLRIGISPHNPDALGEFLGDSDAVVMSAPMTEAQEELIHKYVCSDALVVIDLEGNHDRLRQAQGNGTYWDLSEVAQMPFSSEDAARIALAEKMAFERALSWHREKSRPLQLSRNIKVGGRASTLSRVQIFETLDLLRVLSAEISLDVVTMDAPCDRDRSTPLPEVREDDFFTHDLDEALLRGNIDLAVHSAKDLPSRIPEGLCVAAVTPAFAPWECLVTREGQSLAELPRGAKIGTSSERRRQGLSRLRSDLNCCDVRGNVPDRLTQLEEGKFDALILAAAGLIRLELEQRISQVFSLKEFPSTPGQGALALVVREEDSEMRKFLEPLDLGQKEGLPWL